MHMVKEDGGAYPDLNVCFWENPKASKCTPSLKVQLSFTSIYLEETKISKKPGPQPDGLKPCLRGSSRDKMKAEKIKLGLCKSTEVQGNRRHYKVISPELPTLEAM